MRPGMSEGEIFCSFYLCSRTPQFSTHGDATARCPSRSLCLGFLFGKMYLARTISSPLRFAIGSYAMDWGDLTLVGTYYNDIYLDLEYLFGHLAWDRVPPSRVVPTCGVIFT